ncbi:TIMELESS domain-containing protein [Aphelenchoides fujianensis]|nr:TIMELESS domain-containing protein [Aphelenchoides fujianensis]
MGSSTMEKVIQATVSSLGYLENNVYYAEPDCYASVHDLIRYLHNDNETLDVRRICLARNIVRNDLVPILTSPDTNDELFNLALRLTANLCQPALLAFGGKLPDSDAKDAMHVYCELERHLVDCLKAFTGKRIFEKLAAFLKNYYDKEWTDRPEAEKTVVDRIVMLIRYIFSIGMEGPISSEAPSIAPSTKERMIHSFLSTEMPQVLMRIGCDRMEKELSVHIMSILSLLFRCIDCEKVATIEAIRTEEEKRLEEEELRETLEHEQAMVAAKRAQRSTRTFLGGNYTMKNAALNPDKEVIVGKIGVNSPLEALRPRKQSRKTAKRFRIRNELESLFKPNKNAPASVCSLLKAFSTEFINNSFDRLMKTTRETAFANNKQGILAYSDVNYFFLCEYVLQFIRLSKMSIAKIGSVFSRDFFNHVISQTGVYFDTMVTDKHHIRTYAIRAQHAISAYKELMQLLHSLSKAEAAVDQEAFAYMTRAIYYMEEYREFGYTTLGQLKPDGMTRRLLEDLIVANHFYILTLERIIKKGELIKVAKRKRLVKRKKKEQRKAKEMLVEANEQAKTDALDEQQLEELWTELTAEVDDVLGGKIEATADVFPINALMFAVLQIQRALRGRRICDAIGLFRAARVLWPDSTFGGDANTAEEDRELLREIFGMQMADIGVEFDAEMRRAYGDDAAAFDAENPAEDPDLRSVSDEERRKAAVAEAGESEDDEPKFRIAEIEFDFNEYIFRFAKADVIHWYAFVFKDFKTNEQLLNKAVLKMFHRFAFQLNSPSRLYMATLFRTFTALDAEIRACPPEMRKKHKFFEPYEFGYHLLRKFFAHYKERGNVLICELLFSKTVRECTEIEHGYGTYEEEQSKAKLTWTEELEEELRTLYHQYTDMETKPEGITLLEFIQHNLAKERTPNQISRQLKRMGLTVERPKKKGVRKSRAKKPKLDEQPFITSRSPSPAASSDEEEDVVERAASPAASLKSLSMSDLGEHVPALDSPHSSPRSPPAGRKSRSSSITSPQPPLREPSADRENRPPLGSQSQKRVLLSDDEELREEADEMEADESTAAHSKRVIDSDEEEEEDAPTAPSGRRMVIDSDEDD